MATKKAAAQHQHAVRRAVKYRDWYQTSPLTAAQRAPKTKKATVRPKASKAGTRAYGPKSLAASRTTRAAPKKLRVGGGYGAGRARRRR